jgi:hypothetical protein
LELSLTIYPVIITYKFLNLKKNVNLPYVDFRIISY